MLGSGTVDIREPRRLLEDVADGMRNRGGWKKSLFGTNEVDDGQLRSDNYHKNWIIEMARNNLLRGDWFRFAGSFRSAGHQWLPDL